MPQRNRKVGLFLPVLFCSVLIFGSGYLRGGDNIEGTTNGNANIIDVRWDRRVYDGTPGWDGFVKWHHNPSGIPMGPNPPAVDQTNFQNAVQAAFNTWTLSIAVWALAPRWFPSSAFREAPRPLVPAPWTASMPSSGSMDLPEEFWRPRRAHH